MPLQKTKKNIGFVLLYAIVLSGIILAMAFGITAVSLQEVIFGTSAKDTDEAFYAADTGIECALYYDNADNNAFPLAGPATAIHCEDTTITPVFSSTGTMGSYDFVIGNLGSSSVACAKVNVLKDNTTTPMNTIITSRGYNIGDALCDSTNPNRVERKLQTSYLAAP